uniref:ATP synthase subunit epsilon, mitochondrial n=1 Tax=Heterorhabditis bacteriophora TaxID=37862 RepID=A0A1I7XK35_HETBA
MVAWRTAGINYVRFSQIAAEVTRQCIKSKANAAKKSTSDATLKMTSWESGKAVKKQ